MIEAVVFDLDGVLIDSEPVWEEVRRALVAERGGHWAPDAQRRLMGMSTPEWARYLSEDLRSYFKVTMSTEQVPHGKPAPDIYLAVTAMLGVAPTSCAAVEDSSNGLRSAAAAGLHVIAIPHPEYPPDPDALALASLVLPALTDLTTEAVAALT